MVAFTVESAWWLLKFGAFLHWGIYNYGDINLLVLLMNFWTLWGILIDSCLSEMLPKALIVLSVLHENYI